MARITAKRRKKLPASKFGLPKKRAYPLDTKRRAGNAKGRAKQQLAKGDLTRAQYAQIIRRANAALRRFGAKSVRKTKKR